jgi:hypothetical protein
MLAFNNKIKIIRSYVPDKVKTYIDVNLSKEINYFQKKYLFKIEFISNNQYIIPEYKIELLNKSKKVINKIENINEVISLKKKEKSSDIKYKGTKKIQKVQSKSIKDKTEEKKLKKPRTLWTRKRKAS